MKKIFTHENRLIVFNIKNILQEAGIDCLLKNEFASGGVGDLSPLDTWPEIWVTDDEISDRAKKIIKEIHQQSSTKADWLCLQCGESNDGHFNLCWNCSHSKN